MVSEDLGEATIVYESREDGPVETTVQNEHVAYFQDHWILKTGEDDKGRDTIQRIPRERVYHVERTVQAFEDEISTLADQVRSFTDELREKLPVGGEPRDRRRRSRGRGGRDGPVEIEVEDETGGTDESGAQPATTDDEA
jgi:hypothetical protein